MTVASAKIFVFDLYGTLVDFRSLMERSVASLPAGFVDAWRAKQLQYAFLSTLMERYEDFDAITAHALDYALAQFDVPLDAARRAELLDAWSHLPPYPEVPATLAELRRRGHQLAVLSNGTPAALERTLREVGLTTAFDARLSVDAVRVYKPRREVYALALERFGCEREQVAFISSNGWDATGAAEFGFEVYWCNRNRLPAETLGAKPAHVIGSLAELLVERG